MTSRLILPVVLLFLFAQCAKAETVIHCRMFDRNYPSTERNESWLITDTHFLQLGARYERPDMPGLANKKITSQSESVVAGTWDHEIEGTYSFEVYLYTGMAVETSTSRRANRTAYGKCLILDRTLDGSEIPPRQEWKIP